MVYSKASQKTKENNMLRDERMLLQMASVDNLSMRAIASNFIITKSTLHRRIKA